MTPPPFMPTLLLRARLYGGASGAALARALVVGACNPHPVVDLHDTRAVIDHVLDGMLHVPAGDRAFESYLSPADVDAHLAGIDVIRATEAL